MADPREVAGQTPFQSQGSNVASQIDTQTFQNGVVALNTIAQNLLTLALYGRAPILTKSGDYAITSADLASGRLYLEVDATGGAVQITFGPSLGSAGSSPIALIVKTDTTGNNVTIYDGSSTVDTITTAATSGGAIGGYRMVYSNGTNLRSMGTG